MKKFIVLICLLLLSAPLFSKEYVSALSTNRDNYFVGGDEEDQTKFQLSLKFDMLFKTGAYFGYTQTTWWEVYNGADTMSSNYQPEVFFKLDSKNNIFGDVNLGVIDYIQISPFNHCSTGTEGDGHRSINTYYLQMQISSGGRVSIGDNIKVFNYYNQNKRNADIEDYKGYYENDIFLKVNSATVEDMTLAELHFKHGGTLSKGWLCVEAQTIIFSNMIQPRLFGQYYYGYGENIVEYNIKEHSAYLGLIF